MCTQLLKIMITIVLIKRFFPLFICGFAPFAALDLSCFTTSHFNNSIALWPDLSFLSLFCSWALSLRESVQTDFFYFRERETMTLWLQDITFKAYKTALILYSFILPMSTSWSAMFKCQHFNYQGTKLWYGLS